MTGSRTPQLQLETNIPLGVERSRKSQHSQITGATGQAVTQQPHLVNRQDLHHGVSKSLNSSYEIMNASNKNHMKSILLAGDKKQLKQNQINSDRGGATSKSDSNVQLQQQQQHNFDQTYFGDSFQIQKESLRNLQQDDDDDLLRDGLPENKIDHVVNGPHDDEVDLEAFVENQYDESLSISPINKTGNQTQFNKRLTSKIDTLNFEVQIKSIVSRIKDYTAQIKDRVKSQKELSETFIQGQLDIEDEQEDTDMNFEIGIGKQENGLDVSAILQKPVQLDKSAFAADTSMLMNQANNFLHDDQDKDASFFLMSPPPANEDKSVKDTIELQTIKHLENDETQQLKEQQVPLHLFEKVVKDLQSKHRAEKDAISSEIMIFKKVIHLMGAKIRYLQDEIMDKDKLERDLFKVTHLNMKLENQYKRMREENRQLNEKVEVMRKVMYEFDMQILDEQTHDNYMIEQLIKENHQLQRLLLISETGGQADYTSIEDQIRDLESQTVNLIQSQENIIGSLSAGKKTNQLSYYNKKRKQNQSLSSRQSQQQLEPLNQSMPNEIKQMILERQIVKEDERRINMEMRRIAEEEIMKELKMAEEYYIQSEFQKTNKNFPIYKESDLADAKDDDDDEVEEENYSKNQNDDSSQQYQEDDQQENNHQNPPPSSPLQQEDSHKHDFVEEDKTDDDKENTSQSQDAQEETSTPNQTIIHQQEYQNNDDDQEDSKNVFSDDQQQMDDDNSDEDNEPDQNTQTIIRNSQAYIDDDSDEEFDDSRAQDALKEQNYNQNFSDDYYVEQQQLQDPYNNTINSQQNDDEEIIESEDQAFNDDQNQ
eukprot:403368291